MSIKNNPLINGNVLKYGAIPFYDIKLEHFIPALDYALSKANEVLNSVINNTELPTFENTALPIENAFELIENIAHTYFNLMSAESNDSFKELAQQISPKISSPSL